jgi:hypothetical protein
MIAGSSTQDEAGEFLERFVALYNAGVRTRDFSGLLAMIADDAVLDFEGVSERAPLSGKLAIAQHFEDDPPDNCIRIKRWKKRADELVAEFTWVDIPEGGGCLLVEPRDGRAARITIAFGGPRRLFR